MRAVQNTEGYLKGVFCLGSWFESHGVNFFFETLILNFFFYENTEITMLSNIITFMTGFLTKRQQRRAKNLKSKGSWFKSRL